MAVAILPMLSIGGMQLFKTESYETPDKIIPRAAIFASGISLYRFNIDMGFHAMACWNANI